MSPVLLENSIVWHHRSMKHSILRGFNTLFSIQEQFQIDVLTVEFSKMEASSGINKLFTHYVLEGMLVGKDFPAVDYIFPFVADFSDLFLGLVDKHKQTTPHSRQTDLMNLVTCDLYYSNSSEVCQIIIEDLTSTLKHTSVDA